MTTKTSLYSKKKVMQFDSKLCNTEVSRNHCSIFHLLFYGQYVGVLLFYGQYVGVLSFYGRYAGVLLFYGRYVGVLLFYGRYVGVLLFYGRYVGVLLFYGRYVGVLLFYGRYVGVLLFYGRYVGVLLFYGRYVGVLLFYGRYVGVLLFYGRYVGVLLFYGRYVGVLLLVPQEGGGVCKLWPPMTGCIILQEHCYVMSDSWRDSMFCGTPSLFQGRRKVICDGPAEGWGYGTPKGGGSGALPWENFWKSILNP